jgi:hypothetical protein
VFIFCAILAPKLKLHRSNPGTRRECTALFKSLGTHLWHHIPELFCTDQTQAKPTMRAYPTVVPGLLYGCTWACCNSRSKDATICLRRATSSLACLDTLSSGISPVTHTASCMQDQTLNPRMQDQTLNPRMLSLPRTTTRESNVSLRLSQADESCIPPQHTEL